MILSLDLLRRISYKETGSPVRIFPYQKGEPLKTIGASDLFACFFFIIHRDKLDFSKLNWQATQKTPANPCHNTQRILYDCDNISHLI